MPIVYVTDMAKLSYPLEFSLENEFKLIRELKKDTPRMKKRVRKVRNLRREIGPLCVTCGHTHIFEGNLYVDCVTCNCDMYINPYGDFPCSDCSHVYADHVGSTASIATKCNVGGCKCPQWRKLTRTFHSKRKITERRKRARSGDDIVW